VSEADNNRQDLQLLRLAVQNLACAPQAQRRYVQLGMMPRALGNLERVGARLDEFVEAGALSEEQAELIAQLRGEVSRQLAEDPSFLEEQASGPREFLFSHALENDRWHRVRHLARRCFTALAGEESPFVAVMAR
jgi:hypothetical protein